MTSFKYAPWFDKHYTKFKIYDAGIQKNSYCYFIPATLHWGVLNTLSAMKSVMVVH